MTGYVSDWGFPDTATIRSVLTLIIEGGRATSIQILRKFDD